MKHLTKILVGLAVVFVVGYYLQATGHESQGLNFYLQQSCL